MLGYAVGEHPIGAIAGPGTITRAAAGDPSVGGGAVGEPERQLFDPSEIQWRSAWEIILDCGDLLEIPLHNPATACGHRVSKDNADLPADYADVPVNAGTYEFVLDGITYTVTRWRVYWYSRVDPYEELYDWTRCSDCSTQSINKWRYWSLDPGTCQACYANQGGGLVPVGTQPTSGKTTLHMVHEEWSDFFGDYVWHTVRRYKRNSPGGLKAPEEIGYHLQQVWELKASVKPEDFPRHIKPQGGF